MINGLFQLASGSAEETFAIGQRLASSLTNGSVVALIGELGSGKTCLVKGIINGLGIKETVTSPTYTIINEYSEAESPVLYHIDAYRLNNDEDFAQIGGLEIIHGCGISLIEWSERIPKSLPENKITITIKITGQTSRIIQFNGLEKL